MHGLKNALKSQGYPSPAHFSMEKTNELQKCPSHNRCSEVFEKLRCLISINLREWLWEGGQIRCCPNTQKSVLPSASSANRKGKKKKMTETTPVYNNTIHYLTETAPQICALPCTHQLLGLVLLLSFVSWVEANVAAICHSPRYRGQKQQWDPELCSTPKTTTASETFSSNWTQLWGAEKCVELSSFHIIT